MVKYTRKELEYVKSIRDNLSDEEIGKFLRNSGWETWYSPDYWIHSKVVDDPEIQDMTDYGISRDEAFVYEILNAPPIPSKFGLASMNMKIWDIIKRNES